jgi:membrane-associated phospholipid phosphatase
MESLYQLGISMILFFQEQAPWLIKPMAFFTSQISELFYMVLIAGIFWCWSTALGLRIGLLLLFGQGVKSFCKLLFHQPRPFWINPKVQAFNLETSFGIPSGHAMDATVVLGGIAAWIGKAWAWIVAILLILFIGLSRVVIGVHFPTDVLAGWLIGAIILVVYLKLEKPVSQYLKNQQTAVQILIAFAASLVMILLNALAVGLLGNFSIPQAWQTNFQIAFPGEALDPYSITGVYSAAGTLFGLGLGIILIQRQGGYDAGGIWWKRVVRFILGILGLVVLYLGLSLLFDQIGLGGSDLIGNIFRYFRYGMIGLWAFWIAPMIFVATKLAKRPTA